MPRYFDKLVLVSGVGRRVRIPSDVSFNVVVPRKKKKKKNVRLWSDVTHLLEAGQGEPTLSIGVQMPTKPADRGRQLDTGP